MSGTLELEHRCDQCAHVDMTPRVHLYACRSPRLIKSLPCRLVRDEADMCGPGASWWEPAAKYSAEDQSGDRQC